MHRVVQTLLSLQAQIYRSLPAAFGIGAVSTATGVLLVTCGVLQVLRDPTTLPWTLIVGSLLLAILLVCLLLLGLLSLILAGALASFALARLIVRNWRN